MATITVLPMQNTPQVFQITLVNTAYTMTVKWNDQPDAGWVFDLDNADTGVNVVANIPFITGADCLAGLEYLGIGGQIYIYTNGDQTAVPTIDNFGTDSNAFFVTPD